MPLVSYRASAVASWSEIHEVAGRRQSAKQVLKRSMRAAGRPGKRTGGTQALPPTDRLPETGTPSGDRVQCMTVALPRWRRNATMLLLACPTGRDRRQRAGASFRGVDDRKSDRHLVRILQDAGRYGAVRRVETLVRFDRSLHIRSGRSGRTGGRNRTGPDFRTILPLPTTRSGRIRL
jgi:hypothetical protein